MSIKRLLSQTALWKVDADTRAALQEVLNLKDRDQYIEAAARAGRLYDEGMLELRALGILLYGTFLARGLESLPELFLAAEAALTRCWDVSIPVKNRERHAETSLRWFFSRLRRETLERTESPSPEFFAQLSRWPLTGRQQAHDALRLLRRPLVDRFENEEMLGQVAAQLDWLETLKRNRLGLPPVEPAKLEPEQTKRSPEQQASAFLRAEEAEEGELNTEELEALSDGWDDESSLQADAAELSDDEAAEEAEFAALAAAADDEGWGRPPAPASPPPRPAAQTGRPLAGRAVLTAAEPIFQRPALGAEPSEPVSTPLPTFRAPALRALLERLATFETLMLSGQLVRASVIAEEVRRELETFDPLRYLPELFSTYFSLQVQHLQGLQAAQLHPAREMLTMLYRVDPERFLVLEMEDEG